MHQEEPGLFEVRFTEQGKKFIRKFAAISYFILTMVIFQAGVNIYWNIKALTMRAEAEAANKLVMPGLYFKLMPYISILIALGTVVSNIYYLRFPNALLRCMETNDELGANKTFDTLYKGAFVFLILLLINTATMVWSLTTR